MPLVGRIVPTGSRGSTSAVAALSAGHQLQLVQHAVDGLERLQALGPEQAGVVGDLVVVHVVDVDRARSLQHVLGDENGLAIEATGRLDIAGHPYENRYCFVAELRGGKVGAFRMYLDTLYAAQAVQWLVDAHQAVPGETTG